MIDFEKASICAAVSANEMRIAEEYVKAEATYAHMTKSFGERADILAAQASCLLKLAPGNMSHIYTEAMNWREEPTRYFNNDVHVGHTEKARVLMNQALHLDPYDVRIRSLSGLYHTYVHHDYRKAAQEFRTALKINPHSFHTYLNGAYLYNFAEAEVTENEAVTWLHYANRVDPTRPICLALLAIIYQKAGRVSEAKEKWAQALSLAVPLEAGVAKEASHFDELQLLVTANDLRLNKKFAKALAIYQGFPDIRRRKAALPVADCHSMMFVSSESTSGDVDSIKVLTEAVKDSPNEANLHFALADCHMLYTANFKQGLYHYSEAIRLSPYCSRFLATAASWFTYIPKEVDYPQQVINWYERSCTLEPDVPYTALGAIHHQSGDEDKAKKSWLKSLLCTIPVPEESGREIMLAMCK